MPSAEYGESSDIALDWTIMQVYLYVSALDPLESKRCFLVLFTWLSANVAKYC